MKKMCNLLTEALIIALISGPTALGQTEVMHKFLSGVPEYSKERCQVPFELDGHKIIVKAKLNSGEKEYSFMLDTGAMTMIDERAAKELNLKKGAQMPAMKPGETAHITRLDSITLGSMKVKDFELPVIKISSQFDSSFTFDGFIGSDILRFFRTGIDYENKIIVLYSPDAEKDSIAEGRIEMKIALPFPFRYPVFPVTIEDSLMLDGFVDTGSPSEIVLPIQYADKLSEDLRGKLIKSKGLAAKWPNAAIDYNYIIRMPELTLGTLKLKNIPVIFAELPEQIKYALIGKSFLDKYITTIDYPKRKLVLKPVKNAVLRTNIYSTGLTITKHGNVTLVQSVWSDSPADKANILPGQYVVEINGRKTESMKTDEINSVLEDDKPDSIILIIKAGESYRTVKLKKQLLFQMKNYILGEKYMLNFPGERKILLSIEFNC